MICRARNTRVHGGLWDLEHSGDFSRWHFLDGGERDRLAQLGGKSSDQAFEQRHHLPVGGDAVARRACGPQFLHRRSGLLERHLRTPPPAVERYTPGDARQPGARVRHLRQLLLVTQRAEERLLHRVFGVLEISQNRVRDAEEQRRVFLDQVFQIGGGLFDHRDG